MKTTRRLLAFLSAAASLTCFPACVTTVTTSTAKDGAVTVTRTTSPAPGVIESGAAVAAQVIAEK